MGLIIIGTGGRGGINLGTGPPPVTLDGVTVELTLLGNKLALQIGQFNPFL